MDDWKRWDKLKKLITDFANKTIEQKQKFLSDVASILEYNQKLFLSPKVQRIQNLLARLEYK